MRSLYLKDGWAAVDAAQLAPPQTTEQILHPARYPGDRAVVLDRPDLAGLVEAGWAVDLHDVLGEWLVRKMLEQHLPGTSASTAAEGWGGDIVVLLNNPVMNEQAVIFLIQWDSMRDAHEFTAAYQEYGGGAFW